MEAAVPSGTNFRCAVKLTDQRTPGCVLGNRQTAGPWLQRLALVTPAQALCNSPSASCPASTMRQANYSYNHNEGFLYVMMWTRLGELLCTVMSTPSASTPSSAAISPVALLLRRTQLSYTYSYTSIAQMLVSSESTSLEARLSGLAASQSLLSGQPRLPEHVAKALSDNNCDRCFVEHCQEKHQWPECGGSDTLH